MKSLTPKQQSTQLNHQLQSVAQGVDQAIDWVELARKQSERLDIEADRLIVKLRRHRNKARHLSETVLRDVAIGFFGRAQAGKSYLISALASDEDGCLGTAFGGRQLDYSSQINPSSQSAALVTRFTRQSEVKNTAWPVQLTLLSEVDIARILATAFLHDPRQQERPQTPDERYINEHLKTLAMHRQSEAVAGVSSDDVVALWDALSRQDRRRQPRLEADFWPMAVELAPCLSIDDRASLFSILWGERSELTAAYRHFAWTLQYLSGAPRVLAPLSALVDDNSQPTNGIIDGTSLGRLHSAADPVIQVRPVINGRAGKILELTLAELTMLSVELLIPLRSATREPLFEHVDLLDFPGFGGDFNHPLRSDATPLAPYALAHTLLHAKAMFLLERYTDNQAMNLLMVSTAASDRTETRAVGQALDYWVRQTQGESAQIRSRRKPGLIWVLTAHDQRVVQGKNHDEAVQRYVGNPGDAWGSMLALDKRGTARMAGWLTREVRREVKLERIDEQLSELRRELVDNLLSSWYQPTNSVDPASKQRIAQTLIKGLQARAGVHGELLERLLPARDDLRRLYLQLVQTNGRPRVDVPENASALSGVEPFGIGISIDLFDDAPDVASDSGASGIATDSDGGHETDYARQVYRYWINHLRSLPDNGPLVELLGVAKPVIEMLMEELITASFRLNIGHALQDTLAASTHRERDVDRLVSRVLTVLGDFVAWLGFQQMAEALRPESRINRGQKIFAKPKSPAINLDATNRLTRLAPTPTNNTASYIYDWLVGLSETIVLNAGYAGGSEINRNQRKQLGAILQQIKPDDAA
ncbi:virulence factor [Affinibrenneria salicis]|uniref:Virulence factor n=1 Tax=Affinibrenneria salicis TaxID=2590031 RepID=A0A5J5G4U5_9GAMM|nr:virulence factor SrfC family protein [Affinibrenneria salicis]KAA9001895.1 virulence factor [Affinibrenneria salicis]